MWSLTASRARLQTDLICGSLDLRSPASGIEALEIVTPQGPSRFGADTKLLQLLPHGNQLTDHYVRGHDLVAQYSAREQQTASYQVYWRCDPNPRPQCGVFGSLELILSVQTHLLDADPTLSVISDLPAGPMDAPLDGLLYQFRRPHLTYVEMAHPSNHLRTQVESPSPHGGVRLHHQFFSGRLEKGVIRRARLRVCFLDPDSEAYLPRDLLEHFAHSPPPLTT